MRMAGADHTLVVTAAKTVEVFARAIFDDEVLSKIPVVSMAVDLLKARDTVSDRLLAWKYESFLQGLHEANPEAVTKTRELLGNNEDAKRIGQVLVFTIDRLTELEKALILGKLFAGYLDGKTSSEEFRRLARAVDVVFLDDFMEFLRAPQPTATALAPVLSRLVDSGLSFAGQGIALIGGGGSLHHAPTPLGELARNLLRDWAMAS
jgi:hypothetical protein